jgi:hypothetical protein
MVRFAQQQPLAALPIIGQFKDLSPWGHHQKMLQGSFNPTPAVTDHRVSPSSVAQGLRPQATLMVDGRLHL